MSRFADTKTAKVIRFLAPVADNEFLYLAPAAIVWALILASPFIILFYDSLNGLVVVGMLPLIVGLMILISAAHGNFLTSDSGLTRAERKGARQLQKTRDGRKTS